MTIETSTDVVPLINVGTYWGPFEYEHIWEPEAYDIREERNGIVCDDYDHAKFGQVLVEEANRVFEDEKPMSEHGVLSVKATKFWSPREYNFADDRLFLDIEVADDFLEKAVKVIMAPENKEKVSRYMEDHWKTRDGFISSMPAETYGELEQLFQELGDGTIDSYYYELGWGSVVALLWLVTDNASDDLTEGEGYLTELLYDRVSGNHSLSEFCTVLYEDEWKGLYGKYMIDFDTFRKQLDEDTEKYCKSGVGEDSQAKAKNYRNEVLKRVECYERDEQDAISTWHPEKNEVKTHLAETKKKWEEERDSDKWREYWTNKD